MRARESAVAGLLAALTAETAACQGLLQAAERLRAAVVAGEAAAVTNAAAEEAMWAQEVAARQQASAEAARRLAEAVQLQVWPAPDGLRALMVPLAAREAEPLRQAWRQRDEARGRLVRRLEGNRVLLEQGLATLRFALTSLGRFRAPTYTPTGWALQGAVRYLDRQA